MARYVRLYNSPTPERPGSILGFSKSIAEAAYDDGLSQWLVKRGYSPVMESEEQRAAHVTLPMMPLVAAAAILKQMGVRAAKPEDLVLKNTIPTEAYYTAPGIPLPERTVSVAHMFIEPPLQDDDLVPLGQRLSFLGVLDDNGLRQHHFVDNRGTLPVAEDTSRIIYSWG